MKKEELNQLAKEFLKHFHQHVSDYTTDFSDMLSNFTNSLIDKGLLIDPNTAAPVKEFSDRELDYMAVIAYCKHSEVEGFIFTTHQGRSSQDESTGYCYGYQNGYVDGVKWYKQQLTKYI